MQRLHRDKGTIPARTAAVLAGAGYAVLSFDYSGWGESEGSRHCLAPFGRVSARARQAKKGAADEIPLAFVDETITFNSEWVVSRISPHAVLLVTGENDLVVPPDEAEKVFPHAGEPKKLSVIEGAGHYDLYTGQAFDEIMGEAVAWFGDHLGQA